jgi:hypothetical protein
MSMHERGQALLTINIEKIEYVKELLVDKLKKL